MATEFRIGHGFDVHRLRRGRTLILGAVEIAYHRGLVGYSDADAVLHALINAILGALGDGDIGSHFSDSDPRFKHIESGKLLKDVLRIMRRKRFKLVNADVTLVAERPKLSPHYGRMRKNVASLWDIVEGRINIKA